MLAIRFRRVHVCKLLVSSDGRRALKLVTMRLLCRFPPLHMRPDGLISYIIIQTRAGCPLAPASSWSGRIRWIASRGGFYHFHFMWCINCHGMCRSCLSTSHFFRTHNQLLPCYLPTIDCPQFQPIRAPLWLWLDHADLSHVDPILSIHGADFVRVFLVIPVLLRTVLALVS